MNFNSIDEIIEYAIEREKEAVDFYTELAGRESLAGARQAFEDFAAEEKKHAELLESFAADKEKLSSYQYKWVPDMKRSNYMVDIEYETGMPFTDALRLAMKREEVSLRMYNELAGKTEQDDCIKMFKILSQEEAKHKSILETIYDDHMAAQGD